MAFDKDAAAAAQRRAQEMLDDVRQQKRAAALTDPGADTFAATAGRVRRAGKGPWVEGRDSLSRFAPSGSTRSR